MYSILPLAFAGASLFAGVLSAPVLPPNDGFPAPNPSQLKLIENLAHGTLPDGSPPPPGAISAEGITNLQFVEFNENFEVAFFSSLLYNVTSNVPGFEIKDNEYRNFVLEVLIAVLAVSLPWIPTLET